MSVQIAILGASGAVGSALAVHILRSGLLEPQDYLMLVGHGAHSIERRLMPVRVDLLDAFDDERVQISVVPDIDEFEADIVVVAAGETKSSENATRRDLAVVNLPIFRQIVQECAARLPRALFIVVSNPVELAVQVLTEVVDRQRVIGMGSRQGTRCALLAPLRPISTSTAVTFAPPSSASTGPTWCRFGRRWSC